jgi:hypothetical protein
MENGVSCIATLQDNHESPVYRSNLHSDISFLGDILRHFGHDAEKPGAIAYLNEVGIWDGIHPQFLIKNLLHLIGTK